MRTTIDPDDDVAAALDRERRLQGGGISTAVNRLIRRGLLGNPDRPAFVQRSASLNLRVDVTNVAEALEDLDAGPSSHAAATARPSRYQG